MAAAPCVSPCLVVVVVSTGRGLGTPGWGSGTCLCPLGSGGFSRCCRSLQLRPKPRCWRPALEEARSCLSMASEGSLSSPGCRCAWCKGFFRSRLWFGAGVICFLRRNDATVPSVGGMRGLGWAVWLQSISSPGKLLQEDLEAFPSAGRNPSWLMYSASCACPVPCLTVLSLSIWIGRWTAWMLFSSSYLFSLFLHRKSGTGECWWSLLPVCCLSLGGWKATLSSSATRL